MNIRVATNRDLRIIERLHQGYADKFALPELEKFVKAFIFSNDKDEPVVFGGLRLVPEVIALTNKEASARDKHHALYPLLWSVENVSRENGFNQIHVFPEDDPIWRNRLKKDGFRETRYPCYIKDV